MEHIKEIVLDYVYGNHSNPSALMINGEWGSGKTYYLKKVLMPEIERKEESIRKKTLYVSLNGVGSIGEILDSLAAEKMSLLKFFNDNKYGKATLGLIKSVSNVGVNALKFTFGGIVANPTSKEVPSVNINDFLDFSKYVLCFDDLERISPNLRIDEVLGFINRSFIEIENPVKVIVIGDEKQISEKKKYHEIKEKLVGRTVYFKSDILEFLNHQIMDESDEGYAKFLKANEKYIQERLRQSKMDNLRTILFMMDSLKVVFKELGEVVIEHLGKTVISSVMSCAFEYKRGRLEGSGKNVNLLYAITDRRLDMDSLNRKYRKLLAEEIDESNQATYRKKEKEDDFFSRYREGNSEYIFISEIYNYITKGYLEGEKLTEELKSHLPVGNPPEFNAANRLKSWTLLDDTTFIQTLEEIKVHMENGAYVFEKHLHITTYLIYFYKNGLIPNTERETFSKFLINCLKKVKEQKVRDEREDDYIHNFQELIQDDFAEFPEFEKEIHKHGLIIFKQSQQLKAESIFPQLNAMEIDSIKVNELITVLIWYKDKRKLLGVILKYVDNPQKLSNLLKLIRDIKTANLTNYSEKMQLDKICQAINKKIDKLDNEKKPLNKYRLKRLVDTFESIKEKEVT